jgi:glycosyltransferase involved in cell wall biosynthesis
VLPKISIVTPSYNQGHFIEQTITSVLNQNYPNLEYIIIDGGSTDNTVEIIKKYEDQLTFWVSEKDSGQANAINKGLQYCTGEIFNWLNSDDYLEPGSLIKIAIAFQDPKVEMVAGIVRNFTSTTEELIPNQQLSAEGLMCWKPGVKFIQPGVWLKRNLLKLAGGIDEQFHYAFDWDFYIRYLYQFNQVKEIPELLVHFRLHEQSKTQSLHENFAIEERKIIEKICTLKEFESLHPAGKLKIAKTGWTDYLSKLSITQASFFKKCLMVFKRLSEFKQVSYSRQTLGALKAFWSHKKI